MSRVAFISVALAGLVLVGLAFFIGASWSGFGYAISVLVAGVGLVASSAPRHRRASMGVGVAIVLVTAVVRAETTARGRTMVLVGPDGKTRAVSLGRVVDEGDAAVVAANALVARGMLPDPEAKLVPTRMREAYARMRETEGDVPSPIFSTYARGQSPDTFDLLIADGVDAPRGAVVFLHGSGGNFALPCWLFARAAREARLVTYCPSTRAQGDWWTKEGEATARRTIALARARGLARVYLAGLSNGGIGASRLAPRMRGLIQGLVLVSGAADDAGAAGVPTLVVHGALDAMVPTAQARAYAARTHASYANLQGGHFGMLTREDDYRRAIAAWLIASASR